MQHLLSFFSLCALALLVPGAYAQQIFVSGSTLTSCPNGWAVNGNSCYLTGERFDGQTWYSAAAFCQSMGAFLVEINDKAEFDFVTSLVKTKSWTDGPWLGLLKLHGDSSYVLPTLRAPSADGTFDKMARDAAAASAHDCGGLDKNGGDFGFWRCRNGGSPLCEIDIKPSR